MTICSECAVVIDWAEHISDIMNYFPWQKCEFTVKHNVLRGLDSNEEK
jgi:hypothetical protein